jgi:hypothetical protein
MAEAWGQVLDPETRALVDELATQAGQLAARLSSGDPAAAPAEFAFPDETWARVIYDVVLTSRDPAVALDRLVAALVPIYFGRVASLILETRDLTTDEAEAFVERQARAFELLKPSFAARWAAADAPGRRRSARPTRPA